MYVHEEKKLSCEIRKNRQKSYFQALFDILIASPTGVLVFEVIDDLYHGVVFFFPEIYGRTPRTSDIRSPVSSSLKAGPPIFLAAV